MEKRDFWGLGKSFSWFFACIFLYVYPILVLLLWNYLVQHMRNRKAYWTYYWNKPVHLIYLHKHAQMYRFFFYYELYCFEFICFELVCQFYRLFQAHWCVISAFQAWIEIIIIICYNQLINSVCQINYNKLTRKSSLGVQSFKKSLTIILKSRTGKVNSIVRGCGNPACIPLVLI